MADSLDIFLSHDSRDKPAVRELKQRMAEQGLAVWLDEDDFTAGSPWLDEIETALTGDVPTSGEIYFQ